MPFSDWLETIPMPAEVELLNHLTNNLLALMMAIKSGYAIPILGKIRVVEIILGKISNGHARRIGAFGFFPGRFLIAFQPAQKPSEYRKVHHRKIIWYEK